MTSVNGPNKGPSKVIRSVTLGLGLIASVSSVFSTMPAQAFMTKGGASMLSADAIRAQNIALILPQIPWFPAADLAEFDRTINQSRDEVRQKVSQEFMDMLKPILDAGGDAGQVIEPLANILLTFDSLHAKHIQDSSAKLGVSLEAIFSAEFDNLYRVNDIKPNERNAMFAMSQLLSGIRHKIKNRLELTADEKKYITSGVRFLPFGTWTISSKGKVNLTFTLENILTGERINFDATGPTEAAARKLAYNVFAFFQTNEYTGWKNPQQANKWIPPSRTMPEANATTARLFCRNQGGRLPYARELLLAMQGGEFHEGGIPVFKDSEIWSVADKRNHDEQHYYFVGQEKASGGAIRTSAGYGNIVGKYWCIKGETSEGVRFFESLYTQKRKFLAANEEEGVKAINTILKQTGENELNPSMTNPTFGSIKEAFAALKKLNVKISIPKSLEE
jgi:hypothetical protein